MPRSNTSGIGKALLDHVALALLALGLLLPYLTPSQVLFATTCGQRSQVDAGASDK